MFSKFLSLIFENPLARIYTSFLRKFIGVASREPGAWIILGIGITVAYFTDLYFQVRSFTGSWASPNFLTVRTVIPWVGYVLACLFIIPFFAELIYRRTSSGLGEPTLEKRVSIVPMLVILGAISLPYGMLIIQSQPDESIACAPQMKETCQKIEDGLAPAIALGNPSPTVIRTSLQGCIASCSFQSQRMKSLLAASAILEEEVRKARQQK